MKWTVCFVLLAAACQSGDAKAPPAQPAEPAGSSQIIQLPKAQVSDAYRADITTLCDVVKLSGADQKPKDERAVVIAMYLGPNLKTAEAREFLVAIQPLQGEPKIAALEHEAKRVGLAKCELANEWR